MKRTASLIVVFLVAALMATSGTFSAVHADETKQAKAEQVGKAIAGLLAINPELAMDPKAEVWGDYYCTHLTKGVTNMVHWAKDPSKDDADIVMLVHAQPFLDLGLKADELPQLVKPPFGPGLTSGQWYYVAKRQLLILPVKIEGVGIKGSVVPKGM